MVPCGDWERPTGDDGEWIQVSERLDEMRGEFIAVRVSGDSMEPRFRHGQVVVIRLTSERADGRIVLAENQDRELTMKKLVYDPDGWKLKSINPAFGEARADTLDHPRSCRWIRRIRLPRLESVASIITSFVTNTTANVTPCSICNI